MTTLALCLNL